MIQKWKEPPATEEDYTQSGARNPLDRIEGIIETIERIDRNGDRAYIPLKWLCARFGFTIIKLPCINTRKDINEALLKWTKEFGQACESLSESLRDGTITRKEYNDIFREMMEEISAGMALISAIKKMYEEDIKT